MDVTAFGWQSHELLTLPDFSNFKSVFISFTEKAWCCQAFVRSYVKYVLNTNWSGNEKWPGNNIMNSLLWINYEFFVVN